MLGFSPIIRYDAPMNTPLPIWKTALRGLQRRCPNCGKGHLFRSYLKQVDHCDICQEPFGHIRADDGPAWLTIIIVGHILVTIMLLSLPNNWPDWVAMTVWPGATAILTLTLLPFCKGLFIAVIWRTKCVGAEE